MSSSKTIPQKDADFNVWQNVIALAALENKQKWFLDSEWIDARFVPARDEWTKAWDVYKNPVTRTSLIVAEKKEKRANYQKLLSILVRNMKVNTRLTDEDRRHAGIVLDDRIPTPVPKPSTYPVAAVDTSMSRCLTVRFRDSGGASAAKPYGVHGSEIRWVIADDAPGIEQLVNSGFVTRSPHRLSFSDAERGKKVWLCLRWQNKRGENGRWGGIVDAIIP